MIFMEKKNLLRKLEKNPIELIDSLKEDYPLLFKPELGLPEKALDNFLLKILAHENVIIPNPRLSLEIKIMLSHLPRLFQARERTDDQHARIIYYVSILYENTIEDSLRTTALQVLRKLSNAKRITLEKKLQIYATIALSDEDTQEKIDDINAIRQLIKKRAFGFLWKKYSPEEIGNTLRKIAKNTGDNELREATIEAVRELEEKKI